MQRGFGSISTNVDTVVGQAVSEVDLCLILFFIRLTMLSQASRLTNATEAYRNVASTHMGILHAATEALTEQGTREDRPTGTTPRKRTWDYADNWSLTKSREEVLRAWRDQGTSNIGGELFLAEHLPLPEGDDGMDEDMDTRQNDTKIPIELDNILVSGSPTAVSSSSSSDSTFSTLKVVPPSQPKKVLGRQTGIPSLGTLTDSQNVYTTRGSRRAR
jgi:kinesin family protein 11